MPLVGIRRWGGGWHGGIRRWGGGWHGGCRRWGGGWHGGCRAVILFIIMFALLACDGLSVSIGGTASPTPNDMPANAQLNQWYTITNGVQVRYEDWKTGSGTDDTVTIARFDPQDITLSVGYEPKTPLYASEWMQQEHALAIINGGYFDADDDATALVVSNGQVWGNSYLGFGGMLWADTQGKIGLRSLRQQPYTPDASITQAIQSSPTLVLNGKRTQFDADNTQNRRSVVAMDRQGRLLFIASPGETFSLDQLADLLASSDLSINIAINLDGGASTGLYIADGGAHSQHVAIESLVKLPLVVIVKAK